MEEDKSSVEELIDVDEEITSLLEEEVETLPQYIVEELIIEELLEELIGSLLFPHETKLIVNKAKIETTLILLFIFI